jgi:hypothetical protein
MSSRRVPAEFVRSCPVCPLPQRCAATFRVVRSPHWCGEPIFVSEVIPRLFYPCARALSASTCGPQLMKPDSGGSLSRAHRTQMAKNDGMAARGGGARGSGPASAGAHAEQTRHRRSIYPSRGDALFPQGEAKAGEVGGVTACASPAGVVREPSGGGSPREIRRTTLCALLRLRAGL